MRFPFFFLLLGLALPATADTLRVAVAANFRGTLETLHEDFRRIHPVQLRLSSASTGVLATQIRHGAPFDIFFAADRDTPALLARERRGPDSECYALGNLALAGGDGTLAQLADPSLSVAIANPATAPYGRAAQQVLGRAAFAAGTTRKLVRGNNVIQALQFWHSGGVDLALLARAVAPQGAVPIPGDWHEPIEQHLLLLNPSPAADAYLQWLRSDRVRSLIHRAGYSPCP